MMQVDLPMPEACDVCPFNYDFCWCKAFKDDEFDQYSDDWNDHVCDRRCRPDYCPLKEQESLLGIQQTADGITFISTGTAQQGEERGIFLGKSLMHEWIYKELLRKGLLTDDIRSVFEQAKRI